MPAGKKAGRRISVDLSGVEGDFPLLSEGPATLTVVAITEEEGQESGQPYLKWEMDGEGDDGSKGKVWENTSLQPQALFKLRGMLEAFGFEIPDKAMDIDLDELIGCQCGGDIVHEEYKNKPKAKVENYFALEEAAPEPAAPVAAAPKKAAAQAPAPAAKAGPKKAAPPAPATTASVDIGDKVSFVDDKEEEQIGKVTNVDEEKAEASVKVGKEIWTVDIADLTVL